MAGFQEADSLYMTKYLGNIDDKYIYISTYLYMHIY